MKFNRRNSILKRCRKFGFRNTIKKHNNSLLNRKRQKGRVAIVAAYR